MARESDPSARPYCVDRIEQLPGALLEAARVHFPEGEVVEGIFVIPPEVYPRGFRWRLMPLQALVFTRSGILHLAAPDKKDQAGKGTWISSGDILNIKLSLVLLYGKLEIWGVNEGGALKIEAEYNTASHSLLSPLLRGLLRETWQKNQGREMDLAREDATFPDFVKTSYSFYHGLAIEALQPDETVFGYVYQPEIRDQRYRVFKHKIFPQTVLSLTSRQLILLQQDLKYKTHHEWIFTFIPLYRISHMSQEMVDDRQKFSIHLIPDSVRQKTEILLEPQNAQKWEAIWKNKAIGTVLG